MYNTMIAIKPMSINIQLITSAFIIQKKDLRINIYKYNIFRTKMNQDDAVSIVESSDDENIRHIKEVIEGEPLYYVLGQFFESNSGKNIATIMEELVKEMKELKILLQKSVETTQDQKE